MTTDLTSLLTNKAKTIADTAKTELSSNFENNFGSKFKNVLDKVSNLYTNSMKTERNSVIAPVLTNNTQTKNVENEIRDNSSKKTNIVKNPNQENLSNEIIKKDCNDKNFDEVNTNSEKESIYNSGSSKQNEKVDETNVIKSDDKFKKTDCISDSEIKENQTDENQIEIIENEIINVEEEPLNMQTALDDEENSLKESLSGLIITENTDDIEILDIKTQIEIEQISKFIESEIGDVAENEVKSDESIKIADLISKVNLETKISNVDLSEINLNTVTNEKNPEIKVEIKTDLKIEESENSNDIIPKINFEESETLIENTNTEVKNEDTENLKVSIKISETIPEIEKLNLSDEMDNTIENSLKELSTQEIKVTITQADVETNLQNDAQQEAIKYAIEDFVKNEKNETSALSFKDTIDKTQSTKGIELLKNTPVDKNEILNQINNKLETLKDTGTQRVQLTLRPENLGRLQIEIISDKTGISTRIITESSQVKDMLEKNLEGLKNTLTSNGVNVSSNGIKIEQADSKNGSQFNFEQENFEHEQGNMAKNENSDRQSNNGNFKFEDEASTITEYKQNQNSEEEETKTSEKENKVDLEV